MTVDLVQVLVSVGVPIVGVTVWLVRQEGRINQNASTIRDIKGDVHYIRQRIDSALNGRND